MTETAVRSLSVGDRVVWEGSVYTVESMKFVMIDDMAVCGVAYEDTNDGQMYMYGVDDVVVLADVWMLWHANGYAAPEVEDAEKFAGVSDALGACTRRLNDPEFPCVDADTAWAYLYFAKPEGDSYPDRVVRWDYENEEYTAMHA